MLFSSFLNPLNVVEVSPTEIPQYNSRWVDKYFWMNRLNPNQKSAPKFLQLWQNNDTIFLQLENNGGQITVETKNCQGKTVDTYIMQQKQQNTYNPGMYLYEASMAQSVPTPGIYYFVFKIGVSPITNVLISEPVHIAPKQPNTLLIRYKNRKFKSGLIFETGIELNLRIKGYLLQKDSDSNDSQFEDQIADVVNTKSVPYRLFDLYIEQIPDWMETILNNIFGCSYVTIDGIGFTKNAEAKIQSSVPAYGMALKNYTIELRESKNKLGKTFDTELITNDQITLTVNSQSKGFADTSENASSSIVQFLDVN